MSERLVAIPLDGVMHLYAVNGEGPVEVGRLDVGSLDVHRLAIIGAALSDLRDVVTSAQVLPAREPQRVHGLEPYLERAELPRGPGRPRGHHPSGTLSAQVLDYVREHGPCSVRDVMEALDVRASASKSPRKRTSATLTMLKRSGALRRSGPIHASLWFVGAEPTATPVSEPPTPVSAKPLTGPAATLARYAEP